MIGEHYRDDVLTGLATDPAPKVMPKAPKFSAWSAVPRGILSAVAEGAGAMSFELQRDDRPESDLLRQERESFQARYGNKSMAEVMYGASTAIRPDPQTASVAESLLFDASRVITKGVGYVGAAGPVAGAVALAGDETLAQADQLQRQGIDRSTALKAGAVQGALTAVGVALPMAGTTLARTAGLYVAGGPGGFMAQQALTREILSADYPKVAEQFDPFDPVGLAVSSLVPLPFAAWGLRNAKTAKAEAFRAGPVPSEPTPMAAAVADAYRPTPEHADAARVMLLSEQRAAANLADPADIVAAGRHSDALARAEDQIAAGERVQVADLSPMITPEQRAQNFAAWFGDSKVVDESGQPLVVYHGTDGNFDSFSAGAKSYTQNEGYYGKGFYFTAMPSKASGYATDVIGGVETPRPYGNVLPVYVSLRNPLEVTGRSFRDIAKWPEWTPQERRDIVAGGGVLTGEVSGKRIREIAEKRGYDGVIAGYGSEVVAFRPEQIKSAIGNSGRFDPNSASLTDSPFDTWAAQITAAVDQMRATMAAEQPTPARAATEAPTTAAPDATPPAAAPDAPAAPKPADGSDAVAPDPQATSADAARLTSIAAEFPDLQVRMDGMDSPMPLSEFLARAKAEADEIEADAPLMQVAAECALLNGPR